MRIHYIHLLFFSYVPRCHVRNQWGELLCPFLKTVYCYVAINSSFYSNYIINYKRYNIYRGHTVAQLVEALRYKPEGRGFDSRWCQGIFH